MTFKKTILLLSVGIAATFMVNSLAGTFRDRRARNCLERHYIFDKTFGGDSNDPILPAATRLPDGSRPEHALDFFRAMERQFAQKSLDELNAHFSQVNAYFNSILGPTDARRLFDLYENYLKCEINIANTAKFRAKSATPREILLLLYKIQNFRREQLGREKADALFGHEVKTREYLLRRALIIDDKAFYGKDKEQQLQELKQAMWGGEEIMAERNSTAYDRYQLKMQLYRKDLSEMDAAERKRKIEAFRKDFFSKETVGRLDEVDRKITDEKEKMARYHALEGQISGDETLTREEKGQKLRALQEKFFGKDAQAFRRRDTIYEGTPK